MEGVEAAEVLVQVEQQLGAHHQVVVHLGVVQPVEALLEEAWVVAQVEEEEGQMAVSLLEEELGASSLVAGSLEEVGEAWEVDLL